MKDYRCFNIKKLLALILSMLLINNYSLVGAVDIEVVEINPNVERKQVQNMQDTEIEFKFKRIVSETPKSIYFNEYDKVLREYGFGYNSYEQNKQYVKFELLDGDFAIVYKGSPYIGEYHRNKNLMGLIKYNLIKINNSENIEIYSEYRFKEPSNNALQKEQIKLKHVLFVHNKRNCKTAQYIYDFSGNLLCRQIGEDIYIADDTRNLLPDWNNYTTVTVYHDRSADNIFSGQGPISLKKVFKIASTPIVSAMMITALVGVVPVYILSGANEDACNEYWNLLGIPFEWWENIDS